MRSTTLSHHRGYHNPSLPPLSLHGRRLLPAERAALSETGLATGRLAPVYTISIYNFPTLESFHLQDLRAALADNDRVSVREDGGDGEAAGALHVHEKAPWGRDEGLELVLAGLTVGSR